MTQRASFPPRFGRPWPFTLCFVLIYLYVCLQKGAWARNKAPPSLHLLWY